jgi:hypothetical protein
MCDGQPRQISSTISLFSEFLHMFALSRASEARPRKNPPPRAPILCPLTAEFRQPVPNFLIFLSFRGRAKRGRGKSTTPSSNTLPFNRRVPPASPKFPHLSVPPARGGFTKSTKSRRAAYGIVKPCPETRQFIRSSTSRAAAPLPRYDA